MLIPWLIYFDKTFQHAVDPNPQTTNNNCTKINWHLSLIFVVPSLNQNPTFSHASVRSSGLQSLPWQPSTVTSFVDIILVRFRDQLISGRHQLFLTVRYAMWGHSCCAATAGHLVRWRPARDFSNRLITVSTASLLARSRLVFFYYFYTRFVLVLLPVLRNLSFT